MLHHRRVHMGRLQAPAFNLANIGSVNPVDKIAIPCLVRIEIGSVYPIYKDVDDIAKTEKEIKMKAFQKEWKNVLGSYSFEPAF